MRVNNNQYYLYLLSNPKGQLEVVSALIRGELVIVEGVRTEMMDESTKCKSVVPASREVIYLNVLKNIKKEVQIPIECLESHESDTYFVLMA